jgi:hypothetical protein
VGDDLQQSIHALWSMDERLACLLVLAYGDILNCARSRNMETGMFSCNI